MMCKLLLGVLVLAIPTYAQYDLNEVLSKSILFYEAQRSGALPPDNRVPWRGDSALGDGSDAGVDLSGGWYDAGDHVKFGFPMAQAAMTLAWGVVEFEAGYNQAGELDNVRNSIRWVLDYFLKCHISPNEFFVQVGDGDLDHSFWGRPEQMTMDRRSIMLNPSMPGSDAAADTASAFAAGYMMFRDVDSAYADNLLQHAIELFSFALDYPGLYTDSIGGNYYRSDSFQDEMCLAAAWLYRATGEQQWFDQALAFYNGGTPWAFSWQDKIVACQMMLYIGSNDGQYSSAVTSFIDSYMPSGSIQYTPGGLAWRDQWGSLRYSANGAFIAAVAYKNGISTGNSQSYIQQQIGYMLGTNPNGRSYVVGYGNNPPVKPHHRAASCSPDHSVPCDWAQHDSPDPNPSVLNGALVGGPDSNDYYEDDRTNYVFNEVTLDYNSGFQSAVAGMIELGLTPN